MEVNISHNLTRKASVGMYYANVLIIPTTLVCLLFSTAIHTSLFIKQLFFILVIISFCDGFDFDGGEIDSAEDEIHNHTLIYIVLKINYTQYYIYTGIPNAHYGKRLTECDLSWGHSQLPTSMGPTTRLMILEWYI